MKNPDRHLQRTKTDSFRNPETLTSESDESDTSPQTPSDYDPEASNLSQNLANPDTTQHQTSSLLPNMSSANQTTASAQISSFSSSISSASSATPTASAHIKKKLKTPTPFSGKREDLRKFLQEIKIYLLANGDAYPTDLDKVLFVLTYMSNGDANSWKEEFSDSAEQKAAQNNSPLSLGTYKELIDLIIKDFSPYDAPKDAIYEMKELKMGNTTIEEHVAKFKMLVTKSKLTKNDAVVEYFRETLPIPLQRNIMSLSTPPTDLDGWYEWAIKLQNNFLRMKSAISKTQNRGGNTTSNTNKKTNEKGPRRFYFDLSQKDPNAMDVDSMSTEERTALMKKGACFNCKTIGHLSRDCPDKKTPNIPRKMKGKELYTHVRALLAEMEEEDKDEFFADAAEEGF